jgi:orotate phosphoribosyltransferase
MLRPFAPGLRASGSYNSVFPVMPLAQPTDRNELQNILRAKSVKFGTFTLASGQTSDVYVDCRLTTCHPRAMPLIGRLFLDKIANQGWRPEAVGGLTMGADPIAFAIARESLDHPPVVECFVVRKERKAHGMQKLVEGLETAQGRKVVILEDVCTKGESSALAIENARAAGMQVLGAVCLLDREAGGAEMLRGRCGIELSSIFKLSEFR